MMVQNIFVLMLLLVNGGDGVQCVVFFNLVVCKLLYYGWKLEGQCMQDVLEIMLVELCDVIQCGGDSLFVVCEEEGDEDDEQVYYLLWCNFYFNGCLYDFLLICLFIVELCWQEVQIWKKVICVISYEFNNLLVLIVLLVYFGGELVWCGKIEWLEEVFVIIEECVWYLEGFIWGYVCFVKLL